MPVVSPKVLLSQPSVDGRAPTGPAFADQWRTLDRLERRWVQEAAFQARWEPDPRLRQLVAGYAWRELGRLPRYAVGAAFTLVLLALAFLVLLDGRGGGGVGGPLGALAGYSISVALQARRLAAALALNIGPPRA